MQGFRAEVIDGPEAEEAGVVGLKVLGWVVSKFLVRKFCGDVGDLLDVTC